MSDFCIVLLLISFFLGMGNGIYLIEGNETLVINVIFVILGFVGTIQFHQRASELLFPCPSPVL